MYFSIPFFTRPRSPSTTGIVVVFMPHIFSISVSRSLYFESFSVIIIISTIISGTLSSKVPNCASVMIFLIPLYFADVGSLNYLEDNNFQSQMDIEYFRFTFR